MKAPGSRRPAAAGNVLLLAQMVLDRRLSPQDPLAPRGDDPELAGALLDAA